IRIGIAGTAEHEHRLNFGMLFLNVTLGEAGVVAAKLVVVSAKRRAVRGGPEEDGTHLTIGRTNPQHRDTAVSQAARVDAENDAVGREFPAVHGEMDNTSAPG